MSGFDLPQVFNGEQTPEDLDLNSVLGSRQLFKQFLFSFHEGDNVYRYRWVLRYCISLPHEPTTEAGLSVSGMSSKEDISLANISSRST